MGAKQQHEMKARAEHLRKQRDLLLAQRKKQREAELANYTPMPAAAAAAAPPPAAPAAVAAPPPSMVSGATMMRSAGYSSGVPSEAQDQRAQLSRSLAASMKADLASGGNAEEALIHERAERRADLEATKASLRREVEMERAGMRGY